MNRILKLALTLLLLFQLGSEINAGDETGSCRYYNDPHLIPFPTSPDDIQDQYICRNNCTEILVKNEFLEIFVTPDPLGDYPIIDYTVIFFATDKFPQPCVITDSIANPSPPSALECQGGSPAATTSASAPSTLQHHFHLTENIQVDIEKRKNSFFNILVTQSFDLIRESTGVCVKWDCEFEHKGSGRRKRRDTTNPTISAITDAFINTALDQALGKVDRNLVESLRAAVLYDINTTLDQTYAETIAQAILQDSVKQDKGSDEYKERLLAADAVAQKVICDAGSRANTIIAESEPVCNEKQGKRRCLAPVDYTQQCPG